MTPKLTLDFSKGIYDKEGLAVRISLRGGDIQSKCDMYRYVNVT